MKGGWQIIRLAKAILAALLIVLPSTALAVSVDFGPAAQTGPEAAAGIDRRAALLRRTMACGNELIFMGEIRKTFDIGRWDEDDPNTTAIDEHSSWRVTDLVAKAGFMAMRDVPAGISVLTDSANPPIQTSCTAVLGPKDEVLIHWAFLARNPVPVAANAADTVNQVYREMFGEPGLGRIQLGPGPCDDVASIDASGMVVLRLSVECLAHQIMMVITNPDHGAWTKNAKGERIPSFPGTSATKLPCLPNWQTKLASVNGDWDQAVLEYTRLAYLLHRAQAVQPLITADASTALNFLNRNLLTIRSGPNTGATAAESYNVMFGCGNFVNEYGDAIDTMNGDGSDPNYDSYAQGAKDEIGGDDSFWDDLWDFLKALAFVAAIAALAALIGLLAGLAAAAMSAGAMAAATGLAVGLAVAIGVFVTAASVSIQETENHLLMQNSERYLKNKLMMAELSEAGEKHAFDRLAEYNEDLRLWILDRLSNIAEHDFIEYNSKPYGRLSHVSILNLLDYACEISWDFDEAKRPIGEEDPECGFRDAAIVDSAAAIFDLSAAKVAVGSLQGRRFIPYRRLATENAEYFKGRSILEQVKGADNLLGALEIWTGDARQAPGGVAEEPSFSGIIWYATTKYKPSEVILGIAVDKSVRFDQDYKHYTKERYSSGQGWLITAGGTDEGPANGANILFFLTIYPEITADVTNDRGVGVPTTLITRAPDTSRIQDFLRFEGDFQDWGMNDPDNNKDPMWSYSDNFCVTGPFACGREMRMPSKFSASCKTRVLGAHFFIVDSTKCEAFNDNDGNPGNDIFVTIFDGPKRWGFFEVADQRDFQLDIDVYAADLKARNSTRIDDWSKKEDGDKIEFDSPVLKRVIKFTPDDEGFDAERACGVVNHEKDARFTISRVPAGSGCLSRGGRIFIDLSEPQKPVRRGEDGLSLDPLH